MAQESTGSEQTRGAAVWIIVERIRQMTPQLDSRSRLLTARTNSGAAGD